MTILVDTAVWPWRGRKWAHLASDESYEELHEFACLIGKRRVGFQGDHYDVDEGQRSSAIEAGAAAVESRDLVRRLRTSGLRKRARVPDWAILRDGPGDLVSVRASVASSRHPGRTNILGALDMSSETKGPSPTGSLEALVLGRADCLAVVLTPGLLGNENHPVDTEVWRGFHQTGAPVTEFLAHTPPLGLS